MSMDQAKKTKLIRVGEVIFALFLLCDLVVHYNGTNQSPQLPVPKVVVQKPLVRMMSDYITQTGNTVAYNSVNLVARVEGYLNDITFVDGTFIKKGQPLFVIEPETYMAKLREAKATLAAQKAIDAYSKAEYARQKRMYKENATSLNNVEKWLAKSLESAAEIDKAVANVEIAAINYSYTHIQAPFDGRIGRHLVDKGNLVGNGVATTLATIEQINPIYVYFNLNELDLFKVRKAARARGFDPKNIKQIPVFVSLQNETGFKYEGQLDFINTGLNASTGTMEFRALMPNKNHDFVPGLFVQLRVATTKPASTLTVPDTAVLYDQIGAYVLVVGDDNLVALKRVRLGGLEQGLRAVTEGLVASDHVIVSGVQNATPGKAVVPQLEKSAA